MISERKILDSFYETAMKVLAYAEILRKNKVDVNSVKNLNDFKEKVPIIDKEIFEKFEVKEIYDNKSIADFSTAITTSGLSGRFAYRIITNQENSDQEDKIDGALNYFFNTEKNKPLIINALPMGVTFSSKYPIVSTSVRSDMVIHVIEKFNHLFKQIIVVTDPLFAKKILEEGKDKGMNWEKIRVSFAIGGDWSSHSFSNYLESFLESNSKDFPNRVVNTMGVAEIGLNLFSNDFSLKRIVDSSLDDENLRRDLFGDRNKMVAPLFYYSPERVFLEVLNSNSEGYGDLIITDLEKKGLQLIRYSTGDMAKVISSSELNEILIRNGREDLIPDLNLPIVIPLGRDKNFNFANGAISPEIVKEAIYRNSSLARKITGFFKLINKKSGILLELQLKDKANFSKREVENLKLNIKRISGINIKIKLINQLEFKYNLSIGYENKFNYI